MIINLDMGVAGEVRKPGQVSEPVDWWDLHYVEINDNLTCPICQTGLVEPYSTECGHTFCHECIQTTLKHQVEMEEPIRCPVDREVLSKDAAPAPLLVKCMTDDLVVGCPFGTRGCQWQSHRWLLESHIENECQFVHVICSCGQETERRHFDDDTCHCDENVSVVDEKESSREENENESPENSSVGNSLCPGSVLQCGGTNDESHTRNCPLALLAPTVQAQNAKIAEVSAENYALRNQFEQGRRRQLQEALRLDNQLLKEYDRMWRGMAEAEARNESQVKQLMMLSRENIRMTEDMALLRTNVQSLHRQLYHNMVRTQLTPMAMPFAGTGNGMGEHGVNNRENANDQTDNDETGFRRSFQKL